MSLIDKVHALFAKEDVLKEDVEEALKALEARFTPALDAVATDLKQYIEQQWVGLQAELQKLKATIETSLAEGDTPAPAPAEAPAATDVATEENAPPVVG